MSTKILFWCTVQSLHSPAMKAQISEKKETEFEGAEGGHGGSRLTDPENGKMLITS